MFQDQNPILYVVFLFSLKLFEKQDNTQAKECRIYPTIHAM